MLLSLSFIKPPECPRYRYSMGTYTSGGLRSTKYTHPSSHVPLGRSWKLSDRSKNLDCRNGKEVSYTVLLPLSFKQQTLKTGTSHHLWHILHSFPGIFYWHGWETSETAIIFFSKKEKNEDIPNCYLVLFTHKFRTSQSKREKWGIKLSMIIFSYLIVT